MTSHKEEPKYTKESTYGTDPVGGYKIGTLWASLDKVTLEGVILRDYHADLSEDSLIDVWDQTMEPMLKELTFFEKLWHLITKRCKSCTNVFDRLSHKMKYKTHTTPS